MFLELFDFINSTYQAWGYASVAAFFGILALMLVAK